MTSLKSNLCAVVTTQNITEDNCIISHAQNTTALQSSVFFNWNRSVTAHKQGWVIFLSSNIYQNQWVTAHSISVVHLGLDECRKRLWLPPPPPPISHQVLTFADAKHVKTMTYAVREEFCDVKGRRIIYDERRIMTHTYARLLYAAKEYKLLLRDVKLYGGCFNFHLTRHSPIKCTVVR
jgi:hypothetical protein